MKPTSLPRTLLFDLDGTLVDTAPDLAKATNALRTYHGLPPLPYAQIRSEVSNGGNALVTLALGIDENDAAHAAARTFLLEAYGRDVATDSRLFPGLDALLTHWSQPPRSWGIVTNKPRAYAVPLIKALGLEPGVLLCADDTETKKPSPEPLWEAARQLGVPVNECWYIGDHRRDMEAASAAGMVAVAAGYGYLDAGNDYVDWPADLWASTPEALVALLITTSCST
ncbi:HAD family hydrolase [Aidingimonas lacisalsi]|uniref:HAD family hydrolase n=1 Tax=Aidingimonas lacisalsi TaxID=2604086 RepID=UPI0011D2C6EE|nr:HAD-IA family hydrolase [Aidingimonas lacisalsi]